jgi:hypothetical protein
MYYHQCYIIIETLTQCSLFNISSFFQDLEQWAPRAMSGERLNLQMLSSMNFVKVQTLAFFSSQSHLLHFDP